MYGSIEQKNTSMATAGATESFPLVRKNGETVVELDERMKAFMKNPFEEEFDSDFWSEVMRLNQKEGIDWTKALNIVRSERLCAKYKLEKKDPLVSIFKVYDIFMAYQPDLKVMSSLELQIAGLAEVILKNDAKSFEDETKRVYFWPLSIPDDCKKTILHLAAERNLTEVAKMFVELYPGHVYEPTSGDELERLPIELSMLKGYDEASSFLAKNMLHERVRELFESNEAFNARFQFSEIVNNPNMKNTVIAILDCCVNADWPFVPVKEGEKKEEAWSKIPDMPLRYHFYYRLLDGDQNSEQAKIDGVMNPDFDHRSPSCLQLLIDSEHGQGIISHPVIRILVNRKWELFGRKKIRWHFFVYVLYLIFMGVALFIDSKSTGHRSYSTKRDYARGFCEVMTLLMTLVYVISEIDQMEKEKVAYLKDKYNYLDLGGLILVLLIIPLRFTDKTQAEWAVAGFAFLVNCLRVFKYFPAFKDLGLYSKTFAQIIYYDISKFFVLYMIVMIAFTGCVFLSVKAVNVNGPSKVSLGFWTIFLKEIRALAEGNPFNDDYDKYNTLVIILIMINMFAVIVILSNILIGQLSNRYEIAVAEAEIQYSIDKAKFITRLEKSRFRMLNERMAHYIDGDYESDDAVVSSLLEDWVKVQQSKTEERKVAIKSMMEKVLKVKKID